MFPFGGFEDRFAAVETVNAIVANNQQYQLELARKLHETKTLLTDSATAPLILNALKKMHDEAVEKKKETEKEKKQKRKMFSLDNKHLEAFFSTITGNVSIRMLIEELDLIIRGLEGKPQGKPIDSIALSLIDLASKGKLSSELLDLLKFSETK